MARPFWPACSSDRKRFAGLAADPAAIPRSRAAVPGNDATMRPVPGLEGVALAIGHAGKRSQEEDHERTGGEDRPEENEKPGQRAGAEQRADGGTGAGAAPNRTAGRPLVLSRR